MTPYAYPNYPSDWSRYRTAADTSNIPPWFPQMTYVNRFGARFKAAKSYQGGFDSYSDQPSLDPKYVTRPLDHFTQLVHEDFSEEPKLFI